MEAEVSCPYCGESISVWVDEGGGSSQSYVEDCSVCCRPIEISVSGGEEGGVSVNAERADD
jgi:hypothetical protein